MAVVNRTELDRRMDLEVDNPQSIVITPLLEQREKVKDCDAIDVRLGSYFLLPQVPPEPFIVPSKSFAGRAHFRVHVPLGSFLVLPAHHTVLGATLEFIKLPGDLSGQILTKSSHCCPAKISGGHSNPLKISMITHGRSRNDLN
jgi:deoxycytidine triphosphate deaminase